MIILKKNINNIPVKTKEYIVENKNNKFSILCYKNNYNTIDNEKIIHNVSCILDIQVNNASILKFEIVIHNNDFNLFKYTFSQLKEILTSDESIFNQINLFKQSLDKSNINYFINEKYNTSKEKSSIKSLKHNNQLGDYNVIPIFKIIEALSKIKYISANAPINNSNGEAFYNIKILAKTSISEDTIKLSVLSKKSFESKIRIDKLGYFTNVKNTDFSGKTTSGFMRKLESYGCFGSPSVTNPSGYSKDQYKNIMSVLREIEAIIGNVESFNSTENLFPNNNSEFTKLYLPCQIPIVSNLHLHKYITYLSKVRQIDSNIIKNEIESGKIYAGSLTKTDNSVFHNQLFFHMDNYLNDISVEQLYLNSSSNLIKRQIRKNKGLTFRIENKNSKITWFTESTIDALSLKNLCLLSDNLNENHYSYISTQGSQNLISFFKHNFHIGFSKSEDEANNKGWVYYSKISHDICVFTNKEKKILSNSLESIKITFICNKSEKSKESYSLLSQLFNYLNLEKPMIIYNYDLNINNESSRFYVNHTNLNEFLSNNNIAYFKINSIYKFEKIIESKITCDLKTQSKDFINLIKNNILNTLNTSELGLFFDNDLTGLQYCKGFIKMCELLNIKGNVIIPMFGNTLEFTPHTKEDNILNDVNDILIRAKKIKQNNSELEMQTFLDEQFSMLNFNILESSYFKKIKNNAKLLKEKKTSYDNKSDISIF
jgi:hypothetical protein